MTTKGDYWVEVPSMPSKGQDQGAPVNLLGAILAARDICKQYNTAANIKCARWGDDKYVKVMPGMSEQDVRFAVERLEHVLGISAS